MFGIFPTDSSWDDDEIAYSSPSQKPSKDDGKNTPLIKCICGANVQRYKIEGNVTYYQIKCMTCQRSTRLGTSRKMVNEEWRAVNRTSPS